MISALTAEDAEAASALVLGALGPSWTAAAIESERARPGAIALAARAAGPLAARDADALDARDAGLLAARDGRDAGMVVGIALGWTVADELEISVVAVAPEQRRRGLGRALVCELVARAVARGATRGFLEVRAKNAAAIALYVAAGFAETDRRRSYYADGEDAIVMSAILRSRS